MYISFDWKFIRDLLSSDFEKLSSTFDKIRSRKYTFCSLVYLSVDLAFILEWFFDL